ncbi:DsbD-domain-containing protein [Fragilariopsis cylindrus CCMP1102]|uniref:DsbD-domain-containing protein n=1 Tax=Fragilariopsis cylindrus CCMP1102 TaxID=635003 RepID=A0A1E7FVW0_9STRA|nr:DsbD-domain-containing protein [Fragilariopsis cylindrus CCMP1102]|eukprot:OEU22290.1 DsbD-domain-containing protein [Fragilariopsis cylindrus CCMP1102]
MAKSIGRGAVNINLFLLLALGLIQYTIAFQTIGRNYEPHISYVGPKSSELKMMNLEDIMFNAQSTASSMASVSLDDPSNLASSIPIMYAAGLLTAFSPCVWGLLPLTISYISTAAGEREDKKILLPTLSFAFGLASVFCSLGLIAASVGGAVYGNSGNTNIILPIFSNAICCVMGLQLLELIDVPLPALQSSSTKKTQNDEPILIDSSGKILSSNKDSSSKKGEQGSLFRTFLLGGSSALVASPCATPVLTSILAFVANSSNPLLGGFLLLFYTLGYSTPLLVTAATGGKALVGLKELGGKDETSIYAKIAPWVTPCTAGILLWYGTNGLLTAFLGDPSLAGLLALG